MPEKKTKTNAPFGLWPSPISPLMVSRSVRLDEVVWDQAGETVVCVERRDGRGTVMAYPIGDAPKELTPENSVRGGVGYGGGELTASHGCVFFADRDGRLYRRPLGYGSPVPVTPPFGAAASPAVSPDGRWLVYVFSDGNTDLIGLVDAEGQDWPRQLARGADFYMQPAWHPDGNRLAWVEWDHPNMPWDGTRLMLGQLAGETPHISETIHIAGDDETPASQPMFSPDGRWLSYITSNGEWEDLIARDLESGQERTLVKGDGFMLSLPAWVQGTRSQGWSPSSQWIYYFRNQQGMFSLWKVELQTGQSTRIPTAPYTHLTQLSVCPTREEIVFKASSPSIPGRIVRWDGKRLRTVARGDAESISPEMLAEPQLIQWQAPDGMTVSGFYYPPQHTDYMGQGLPPVIVNVHGGPTSQQDLSFSYERNYLTTRGYGCFDLNFRGSTGYGRSYQLAQRGRWGEVDVEDAAGAARALIAQKLADPEKLVIHGGSSGGYAVLNTLIHHPGLYKAGVCLYGVSNLFGLAMDTHKFEAHYNDSLLGPLPEAAGRYHAWSPVFHADRIRDPLAIFQGADDRVVPPEQSEEIVSALRRHGVPHIYHLYEGEGHGFRRSETIADYLRRTERFLQEFVLFAP